MVMSSSPTQGSKLGMDYIKTTTTTKTNPDVQIVIFKYHFPIKKLGLLREMADSRFIKGNNQMKLGYFLVSTNRKAIQ